MPLTADQPQLLDVRTAARRRQREEAASGAPGPVVAVVAGVPRPREEWRPSRPAAASRPAPASRPAAASRPVPPSRSAVPSRTADPARRSAADVLRVVSDPRTPVFVTEHANGRRVYGYWRPLDAAGGRGGCYVALPAAECDELYAAGRITLGEPVTDPAKTTYRVLPARTATARTAAARAASARPVPAPVRPVGVRRRAA